MADALSIAVRGYAHTSFLGATGELAGQLLRWHEVDPIYKAFGPMVNELKYDFCEMALATYLQARDAGKPIVLLPIVLSGNFHHRSLWRWPGTPEISPEGLRGRKVGVRAYSQTTGLWVRGVLSDEYQVPASEVTWVTTEAPHVGEYEEPQNVVRTSESLLDLLQQGQIAAAIVGSLALDDPNIELQPVISDWREAQTAWEQRNGTVPINHMLTVRRDVFEQDPEAVNEIYAEFARRMDESLDQEPADNPRRRALRHGLTDSLLSGVETATRYAYEQGLIYERPNVNEIFDEFTRVHS